MASGVSVDDETKRVFERVKMNKQGMKKLRFAVFKIGEKEGKKDAVIVPDFDLMAAVDAQLEPEAEDQQESRTTQKTAEEEQKESRKYFDTLIGSLPAKEGRYILFDYKYQGSFGPSSKIIFVLWCPNGLTIKQKMLYASSKDALKKSLKDLPAEFQADCSDDLCDDDICCKLRKV